MKHAPLIGLAVALLLVGMVFAPGLQGPFVLDDAPNLKPMGLEGGLQNPETYNHFVWGGDAGPLGRPLSLLTYTWNADTWPTDSYWFKLTNLLIHLGIGVIAFVFLRMAGRSAGLGKSAAGWIALATAFVWMVHPLQSTTVFYVIQRMAQLSALFIILGATGWLHGRNKLVQGRTREAYLWMSISVAACGVIGLLCKENAILVSVLVGALLLTVAPVPHANRTPAWYAWCLLFIGLPVMAIAWLYLGPVLGGGDFPTRSFNALSRFLIQPLVLWDYVGLMAIPPVAPSIFNDSWNQYAASWPLTLSLIAAAAWIVVVVLAWRVRRQHPIAALAVLGFLGLHVLEAGPLSLEVYFLHRNYLAALFPLFGVAYGIYRIPKKWRYGALAAAALGALVLLQTSRLSAELWADESQLREHWREQTPESLRAHKYGVLRDLMNGRWESAEARIDEEEQYFPTSTSVAFHELFLACETGRPAGAPFARLEDRAKTDRMVTEAGASLKLLDTLIERTGCLGGSRSRVMELLQRFQGNPHYQNHKGLGMLYAAEFQLQLRRGRLASALAALEEQLALKTTPTLLEKKARLLQHMGRPDDAITALRRAQAIKPYTALGLWVANDAPRRKRLDEWIARIASGQAE